MLHLLQTSKQIMQIIPKKRVHMNLQHQKVRHRNDTVHILGIIKLNVIATCIGVDTAHVVVL